MEKTVSVGEDLNLLGGLEGMKGKDAKADSIFELVLPIFTATYPEKHIEIGKLFINMGSVSMEKNVSRAERNLLKGLEIVESQNPKSQVPPMGTTTWQSFMATLANSKSKYSTCERPLISLKQMEVVIPIWVFFTTIYRLLMPLISNMILQKELAR